MGSMLHYFRISLYHVDSWSCRKNFSPFAPEFRKHTFAAVAVLEKVTDRLAGELILNQF